MARASAPTSTRSWCRPCTPATSSSPTTSGPTRSPASSGPSRPPGPPSGTCHPTARTSIPSSSASRSSRPSFAPLAVAAPRRSGRSSASAWRTSALTNAATMFGTAGTRPPHGHEKRFSVIKNAIVPSPPPSELGDFEKTLWSRLIPRLICSGRFEPEDTPAATTFVRSAGYYLRLTRRLRELQAEHVGKQRLDTADGRARGYSVATHRSRERSGPRPAPWWSCGSRSRGHRGRGHRTEANSWS